MAGDVRASLAAFLLTTVLVSTAAKAQSGAEPDPRNGNPGAVVSGPSTDAISHPGKAHPGHSRHHRHRRGAISHPGTQPPGS